jgi:hypothetical protein
MAAEQLSVELVAEFVGRDAFEALKREVAQIKNSMNGLGQVQDQVRKQTDAAAGAVRQQRQAFAQTGMQINQFAGQVAAGTPIMTAFVQQIGDVAYVMGQAGESGGRFAAFLRGPWAAAILIGVSVLGPLIAKLFDTKKATEDLEKTEELKRETTLILRNATLDYNLAIARTPIEQRKAIASNLAASESDMDTANTALRAAEIKVVAIKTEIAAIKARTAAHIQGSLIMGEGLNLAAGGASLAQAIQLKSATEELTALEKKLQEARQKSATAYAGMRAAYARFLNFDADQRDAAARAAESAFERERKAAEKAAEIQKEISLEKSVMLIKDVQDFSKAMAKMGAEAEKAIDKSAADVLQETMSNMADQFAAAKKEIDDVVYRGADKIKTMSEGMGEAFSAGIKGMITGAMNFKEVMGNVIDSVINDLFRLFVVQQITGMIAKGLSAVTGITLPAGAKAIGGPVQSGKPYLVGERGPEMFVPSRSGSIVPNGGIGSGINISVDARGSSDPAAVRQQVEMGIMQAAPYIIAAAQNRTLKTAGRARLPGTIG